MLDNIQQAVGNSVLFKTDMPIYEQSWTSSTGTLPSFTPTPWKIVSATSNSNGFFVMGYDQDSGHSAVIRFDSLGQIFIAQENTWKDFISTQYGKLLFVNLLTSPGGVPEAALQAAKGEATPVINIIKSGGGIVTSAAELAMKVLSFGEFLAANVGTIVMVGVGILLLNAGSGNRADYKRYVKF